MNAMHQAAPSSKTRKIVLRKARITRGPGSFRPDGSSPATECVDPDREIDVEFVVPTGGYGSPEQFQSLTDVVRQLKEQTELVSKVGLAHTGEAFIVTSHVKAPAENLDELLSNFFRATVPIIGQSRALQEGFAEEPTRWAARLPDGFVVDDGWLRVNPTAPDTTS